MRHDYTEQNDFSANDNIAVHATHIKQKEVDLTPNLEEAEKFLHLLDPNTQSFTFQTFDDNKQRKDPTLARVLTGSLSDHQDELIELSKRGAGIFVTVQKTDGKGRKKENVTEVRALYADLDDGYPDTLPLEASIIVESSPGKCQAYFLSDDLSKEDFPQCMECLVTYHKADKGAKCLSRVLRLPGFYHQKGDPFQVKIIASSGQSYSSEEFVAAFPPVQRAPKQKKPVAGKKVPSDIVDALSHIPADDYTCYRDVGFALHYETGGSQPGFQTWINWAQTCPDKFSLNDCQRMWASFGQSNAPPITVGSIFHMAREHGWQGAAKLLWPELTATGQPVARSQKNIRYALQFLDIELSYDEFKREHSIQFDTSGATLLDDASIRKAFLDVDELGCKPSKEYFRDTLLYLATQNSFNSCKDYFLSLKWDGTPRLDTFLHRYCGAEDTELHTQIGRKFMAAAIQRVMIPGAKFDFILTLEGAQGAGKSSFARILAGDDRFTDCVHLGDDPKIILEQTQGKWIVEIPELVGLSKRETERVKAALTRQVDVARLAYERTASQMPRQFVFIGTTNADRYLIDATGNRRFWPVKVGKIDLDGLAADRDQLWAEAVHLVSKGEKLFLPEHLHAAVTSAQEARILVNPVEQRLTELISGLHGILPKEELYAALGLDGARTANRRTSHDQLINRVMENNGWKKTRKRNDSWGSKDDNRVYVFIRQTPFEGDGNFWLHYDPDQKQFR